MEEIYLAFDRYLSHDMTAEERAALEQQLQTDEDLAEKLRIYEQAQKILTGRYQSEEKENLFRKNLEVIGNEELGKKQGRVVRMNWTVWAAAASIAFLCAVLFYTSFSKPDYNTYARHYEPLALAERGSEDSLKIKAQRAFNNEDYKEAVVSINLLLKHDPTNETLKMYKGMALLELDQVSEARALFEEVRKTPSAYKDQAIWLLALSALKEKDYKTCEEFLKQIPEGSPEYNQAQKLLNDL